MRYRRHDLQQLVSKAQPGEQISSALYDTVISTEEGLCPQKVGRTLDLPPATRRSHPEVSAAKSPCGIFFDPNLGRR